MNFLKRLGKKIKKGLGKVMGSKIGRIVGMVGLAMTMGAAAKALIGQFQGAAAAGEVIATEAVKAGVTETAKASVAEAATSAGTSILEEVAVTATKRLPEVLEAGAGQLQDIGKVIADASTNVEAGGAAINAMEANTVANVNGVNIVNPDMATVHNNITSAVEHQVNTTFNSSYSPTERFSGYGPDTEFYTRSGMEGSAGAPPPVVDTTTTSILEAQAPKIDILTRDELALRGQQSMAEVLADAPLAESGGYVEPLSFGEMGDRTKEWFKQGWKDMKPESFGEFAGDVGKSVLTGAALQAIAGEPEEQFVSKGVSERLETIPAQNSYMNSIGTSFQAAMNTNVMPTWKKFQDANLFGTGAMDWMKSFSSQPLQFPTMLKLPKLPY